MPTVQRFEELRVWQRARALAKEVYVVTSTGQLGRDFALRDQLRRASISVVSNIAEGFERDGNREFEQFLTLAKGSLGEVQAQLYVALDVGFVTPEQFQRLRALTIEVGNLISGLLRYLRNTTIKGTKFRERPELYVTEPN